MVFLSGFFGFDGFAAGFCFFGFLSFFAFSEVIRFLFLRYLCNGFCLHRFGLCRLFYNRDRHIRREDNSLGFLFGQGIKCLRFIQIHFCLNRRLFSSFGNLFHSYIRFFLRFFLVLGVIFFFTLVFFVVFVFRFVCLIGFILFVERFFLVLLIGTKQAGKEAAFGLFFYLFFVCLFAVFVFFLLIEVLCVIYILLRFGFIFFVFRCIRHIIIFLVGCIVLICFVVFVFRFVFFLVGIRFFLVLLIGTKQAGKEAALRLFLYVLFFVCLFAVFVFFLLIEVLCVIHILLRFGFFLVVFVRFLFLICFRCVVVLVILVFRFFFLIGILFFVWFVLFSGTKQTGKEASPWFFFCVLRLFFLVLGFRLIFRVIRFGFVICIRSVNFLCPFLIQRLCFHRVDIRLCVHRLRFTLDHTGCAVQHAFKRSGSRRFRNNILCRLICGKILCGTEQPCHQIRFLLRLHKRFGQPGIGGLFLLLNFTQPGKQLGKDIILFVKGSFLFRLAFLGHGSLFIHQCLGLLCRQEQCGKIPCALQLRHHILGDRCCHTNRLCPARFRLCHRPGLQQLGFLFLLRHALCFRFFHLHTKAFHQLFQTGTAAFGST